MPRRLPKIGQSVTVLSSKGTPGHTTPDHRGVVTGMTGPHEHMGKTHHMVDIQVDGGRTTVWPDHKLSF